MSVKYTTVNPQKLMSFSAKILEKAGVPPEDAAITARLLVNTDLRGISSHGVAHLGPFYIKRIKEGSINVKPNIKTWSGSPANAVIDGDHGLGFVVAYRAMQEAISRAKVNGMGAVSVRNSTHYGACSAYSLLPIGEDMIGFSCTTGGLNAAAPGASGPVIGMNAFSFAAPSGKEFPFCLDMSTTMAAHGKVEVALRTGQKIPEGWTIDPEGKPITDPKEDATKNGAMVLLGGTPQLGVYKGFGLNIMVDILCSILAGSICLPEARSQPGNTAYTHFCCAIKISGFLPAEEFRRGMDRMIEVYQGLPKMKGVTRITIPGELEWELEQERRKNGIPLDNEVIRTLKDLSKEFQVPYDIS